MITIPFMIDVACNAVSLRPIGTKLFNWVTGLFNKLSLYEYVPFNYIPLFSFLNIEFIEGWDNHIIKNVIISDKCIILYTAHGAYLNTIKIYENISIIHVSYPHH